VIAGDMAHVMATCHSLEPIDTTGELVGESLEIGQQQRMQCLSILARTHELIHHPLATCACVAAHIYWHAK
jgi:hypothetical protein